MGTFRALSGDDVRTILSAFGRGGYRSHAPIAAGTINTNARVECDRGPLFLRINEGKTLDEVVREAAIIEHVAAQNVSTPLPLMASDGHRFVQFGDAWASLFPWVEGRVLGRAEVGEHEAASAARSLALLHLAGRDYSDHRPGRYEPDEIERRCKHVIGLQRPELKLAVSILDPRLQELSRTRRDDLPMGLIHGDLFIDNVLFDPTGGVAALIDFEQASWGRLAYDVAVTLLAFAYGRDDFRPEVTRAFLDAYVAMRPPTPQERAGFGAELRFAACRFAVTRMTDVHLRRAAGAPGGKDFNRYLTRLASVEKHLADDDGLLSFGK